LILLYSVTDKEDEIVFYDAVEDSSQLSPDEDEDHMSPFNCNTDLNNNNEIYI
jgi:hypothetical protein